VKVFDGDAAEGVPRLYHGILRALDANFNDPMTAEDLKPFAGLSGSARLTEMHQKALLVRVNKTVPYQYIASDKGLAIARYVNGTADGPAQRWENNSSALPN
jgi:hypothetical protein